MQIEASSYAMKLGNEGAEPPSKSPPKMSLLGIEEDPPPNRSPISFELVLCGIEVFAAAGPPPNRSIMSAIGLVCGGFVTGFGEVVPPNIMSSSRRPPVLLAVDVVGYESKPMSSWLSPSSASRAALSLASTSMFSSPLNGIGSKIVLLSTSQAGSRI